MNKPVMREVVLQHIELGLPIHKDVLRGVYFVMQRNGVGLYGDTIQEAL